MIHKYFILFLLLISGCSSIPVKKYKFPKSFFVEQVLEFDFNGSYYLVSQLTHSSESTAIVVIDPITGRPLIDASVKASASGDLYQAKTHINNNKGLTKELLFEIVKSIRFLYSTESLKTNIWVLDPYNGRYKVTNIEGKETCSFPRVIFFERSKPDLTLKVSSSSWSCN